MLPVISSSHIRIIWSAKYRSRVCEIIRIILSELKEMEGPARLKGLLERAEPRLRLSSYELEPYAKSGLERSSVLIRIHQKRLGAFEVRSRPQSDLQVAGPV